MTDILDRHRPSRRPRARLSIAHASCRRSGSAETADSTFGWTVRRVLTRTADGAGTALVLSLAWRVYRRLTEKRHRMQASRVCLRAAPRVPGGWQMDVTNNSDQPVHAALVRPVRIRTERSVRSAWLTRETTLTVEHPITIDRTLWPGSAAPIAATASDEMPVLYFSTGQGRSWVRDMHGHLRSIACVHEQVSGRWS